MPIYRFQCQKCRREWEDLLPIGAQGVCCGTKAKHLIPTSIGVLGFKPTADPKYDDMRAKQKAWIDSPATQAKLKKGDLRMVESWER